MVGRILRLSFVAVLLLAMTIVVAPHTSAIAQTDECVGIDAYISAITAIGAQMEDAIAEPDDSDEWTSEDFTAAAAAIDQFVTMLEEMDDIPPVAVDFHDALIAQLDLTSQMFTTMATAGVFGAFAYIDRMETLTLATDAAAEKVETTCGIDLLAELDMDDTGDVDMDEIAIDLDTDDEQGIGSRANPIPLGQTAFSGDDWEFTVVAVEPDATSTIVTPETFNDPPAPGHQFFVATVRVTYIGEDAAQFYSSGLRVVGDSGIAYDQFDDYCGSIPDPIQDRELFTGGTIEGNVCWSVATADADSLTMYDGYEYNEDRVFFSLASDTTTQPAVVEPASTPEPDATPMANGFRNMIATAIAEGDDSSGG